jgi:GntR family transcriptional regulator, transcriptional repressor for pyruvate dehydrogenase complex
MSDDNTTLPTSGKSIDNDDMDSQMLAQKPISKNTIVTQVMARVKDLIASGRYRPGDRLPTEQELATLFGVGRSSIREAIKVFQHLGVVDSKAAKGTFVQDRANISLEAITWALLLGNDDIRDIYELREAIESISFRRVAGRLHRDEESGQETLRRLQAVVRDMYEVAGTDDREGMAEADYLFHQTIIEGGENRLFFDVYHTLQAFMKNAIMQTYEQMESMKAVADDHADIVHVLQTKSVEEAVTRHWQHFRRTRRLIGLPKTQIDE